MGYASNGPPCAHARGAGGRRCAHDGSALTRRASGRCPSLKVGGLQRPHIILPAPTTCAMRSARAALGRAAGRGEEATTRGLDGIHGCDPRPSVRIVSGDVRYWTGVRGPEPHKVLRAHERRVQGDGSRLPWPPLATGHPNRRRPPSPMPKQETRKPHVGQVGLRTTSGQRRKSPADPPICGAPTTTPVRTSSTATPLGLASKDAPRYGAYSRASYPPQTPAATAGSGTAWSRTRCCDARRRSTPCTRTTCTT